MPPEDVLADVFAYLGRVELISSVYLVNRLFLTVADEYPSVRSVLRLHRIVTRSRVTQVDHQRLTEDEMAGVVGDTSEALFVYRRRWDESYAAIIRPSPRPDEVPLRQWATQHCFDFAHINHYNVTPTIVTLLRQLAPALMQCSLGYDWHHRPTAAAAAARAHLASSVGSAAASETIPPPSPHSIITYSQMSALLFDQLLPVFSHGEILVLAGYHLQRSIPTHFLPSPPPPPLLTLPAVLRRQKVCLRLAYSHNECSSARRCYRDVVPPPPNGVHVVVGGDRLVDYDAGHIFDWLHHYDSTHDFNHNSPNICRSLTFKLLGVHVDDLRPLEQLVAACKEVSATHPPFPTHINW
jgi:hypothetical protein